MRDAGRSSPQGRSMNARAALGWCFLALLATISFEGCSLMEPYMYCGDAPCPIGSSMSMGFPAKCQAMNETWLQCRALHGGPEASLRSSAQPTEAANTTGASAAQAHTADANLPKYWVFGVKVGTDLYVQSLYRSESDAGPLAGVARRRSDKPDDFCRKFGYKRAVYYKRFANTTSLTEESDEPLCKRPKGALGDPFILWCVKCSNE